MTTIIDTDGEPLRLAVKAEPEIVSPNELEAEELVGHEFNGVDDRARAVAEIARLGPAEAIMTASAVEIRAIPIELRSASVNTPALKMSR